MIGILLSIDDLTRINWSQFIDHNTWIISSAQGLFLITTSLLVFPDLQRNEPEGPPSGLFLRSELSISAFSFQRSMEPSITALLK